MLIEMSLLLYIVLGIAVAAGFYVIKRVYINPELDLDDPMEFAFSALINVYIVFLGTVWPVTVAIIVGGGIVFGIGYLVWKLRKHDIL